ncbi:MAG: bifunctional riboflavin kinase/FAD synthetase [Clostridia bacterium]|nr:bifunctional riboflavin kinase/FAD synthetase [Clostridia bacterium]
MEAINLRTNERIKITDDMRLSCALGNFDGVHLGHAELLLRAAAKPDGTTHSAVWTFRVHPDVCRKNENARILTSCDQKFALFRSYGIDIAILEDYNAVSSLSPVEFAKAVIFKKCRVRAAVCGFNFRFGKDAEGTAGTLADILSPLGANVTIVPPKMLGNTVISSTEIRKLIECGDVSHAAEMLGHPFSIFLPVTEGRKIGRTIGIPTINQVFPEYYAVPRHGVYACRVNVDGTSHIGISNVGVRPTVTGGNAAVNCETHIIGFDGWLYGKTVAVDFYEFIRPETKFDDLVSLKDQIEKDIKQTINYFNKREAI